MPLGLVPKKEANSFRLIHHLSFSEKGSLNDITDKSRASVSYASVDDAISLIRGFGPGALVAKVTVSPSGFSSLGIYFECG